MDQPPPMKLVMLQGPREGETIEFPLGSSVRIGRVVRGNNVTVKDVGISTKHLVIESEQGKWVVRDLGSSNGTFLNSETIPADCSFDLRDGDTIKIGEYTSIQIRIQIQNSREETRSYRGGPSQEVDVRRQNPPRRGRAGKCITEDVNASARETHNSRILRSKPEGLGQKAQNVEVKVNGRVTRKRKNESLDDTTSGFVVGKFPEVAEDEAKRKKVPRRPVTRNMPEKIEEKESLNKRKTNSEENLCEDSKEENSTQNIPVNVKKELEVDLGLLDGQVMEKFSQEHHGEGAALAAEDSLRVEEDRGNAENCDVEENCRAKETNDEAQKDDSSCNLQVDLEKMTLGQWFDYMESHLPKHIIEATEEIIEGMRKKAEQVREYMVAQEDKGANG